MPQKNPSCNALQRLKSDIRNKTIQHLYVFEGEETFQIRHYTHLLHNMLIVPVTEAFNYHQFNRENFSLESFADALDNLPMMAKSTLIILEDINVFEFNEDAADKITSMLTEIPAYCTVLLTYLSESWKPDKRKKKLWEIFENSALIVEFKRLEPQDLVSWISRQFSDRHKNISNDLCLHLIELTGGAMESLVGEIEKICAYSDSSQIRKDDIDAVTEPILDAVVFHMADDLGQRNFNSALQSLRTLLQMQQEPLAILGAAGSSFRRLYAAKILSEYGKGSSDLINLYNMYSSTAQKMLNLAAKTEKKFLVSALEGIVETDYRIKNSYDDPERLLELFILKLAAEYQYG